MPWYRLQAMIIDVPKGVINLKVAIELNTINDMERFSTLVGQVDADVRLIGKDEHGCDWNLSAKSLLCSVVMAAELQRHREHTAHEVDWNTVYCECEEDIYSLIKDFVKI